MKKLLALFLAIFMLTAMLASCGGDDSEETKAPGTGSVSTDAQTEKTDDTTEEKPEEPEEPTLDDLNAAFAGMKKLKSHEMKIDMTMDIVMSGIQITSTINSNTKTAEIDGKEVTLDVTTTEAAGQKSTETKYTYDGWEYISDGEMKYKLPVEADANGEDESVEFNDEIVKSFKTKELSDGSVKYEVEFNDGKGGFLSEIMGDSLSEMGEGTEMSISDVSFTIKDGYCTAIEMVLEITVSDPSVGEMKMDCDIDMTVVDPGKDVKIDLPDDLDTYEDYSSMLGGM